MEKAKTMKTPMSSSIKLDKDEKGKSIDSTMYRGMIGFGFGLPSLPLACHSRLLLHFCTPRASIDGLATCGDYFKPVFPTLVCAFYSRVTYGIGGPIISTIRGVEIRLDPESICCIFDIALIGLRHDTCTPYGRFFTRVFKNASIREMEGGVDPQSGFQQRGPEGPSSQLSFTEPPHTEIPPHQAPHAPYHAPWMDLSAQINSLGTHMEEFVVVSDTWFYSMEDRMDQYQDGFTS
ncbi:hypothetical protein AAG906_010727 [Vitis piasezkii]